MKLSEIITRVEAALDELGDSAALYVGDSATEDGQGANLQSVIIDKVPYALRWVLDNIPIDLLDIDLFTFYTASSGSAYSEDDGVLAMTFDDDLVATVSLPDDTFRVVNARLSSWKYSPSPVSMRSDTALLQQYSSTMGCPELPVSVFGIADGGKKLYMYTGESTDDTFSGTVILFPDWDDIDTDDLDTDIPVPSKFLKNFIYYIAYLVAAAFRDANQSGFLEIAKDGLTNLVLRYDTD